MEAAKKPHETNQNQKPNNQERGGPWVDESTQEIEKDVLFGHEDISTQQERGGP